MILGLMDVVRYVHQNSSTPAASRDAAPMAMKKFLRECCRVVGGGVWGEVAGTRCSAASGPMNRYPRRATVSMKTGDSADSPKASRSLLTATFKLWSKSTKVS